MMLWLYSLHLNRGFGSESDVTVVRLDPGKISSEKMMNSNMFTCSNTAHTIFFQLDQVRN